jgi:hypothetical protein
LGRRLQPISRTWARGQIWIVPFQMLCHTLGEKGAYFSSVGD